MERFVRIFFPIMYVVKFYLKPQNFEYLLTYVFTYIWDISLISNEGTVILIGLSKYVPYVLYEHILMHKTVK